MLPGGSPPLTDGLPLRVVGVDGYRAGWVSIVLKDGSFLQACTSATFKDVLHAQDEAEVIAVDIPIGLSPTGTRQADLEARRFLRGHGSTVFPTPPRPALEETTYKTASRAAFEAGGKYLSRQSFALLDRIREVDALAASDERVVEVHPEVSFRALADAPLPHTKKTWAGQMQRRSLLQEAGIVLPNELGAASHAPADDVLDAAAAAWSAHRIARGEARSLPDPPERFPDGRTAAIWY